MHWRMVSTISIPRRLTVRGCRKRLRESLSAAIRATRITSPRRSRQDDNYREARRAFLIGYDRSVPRLRQASHCIGCAQCNPHCPQGIDIPKEMQRIDHFVEQLKQNNL